MSTNSGQPETEGIPVETVVSVGTGSTSVLGANPDRAYLQLINDSDTIIYVSVGGGAATVNSGTRLNANGGSVVFDNYVPNGAVTAISSGSSKKLLVTEG